jgi:RNA polymerase sigma-70 factor (ECF subfamily)
MGLLSESLVVHLSPEARRALSSVRDLETLLENLIQSAQSAWPTIDLAEVSFFRHLASHFPNQSDPVAFLRALHGSDLYLACACALGHTKAIAELDRHFLSEIGRYVAKIDRSPDFADEVRQLLREKLFVGGRSSRPKIFDYSGRGPLHGWLRVAAVRTARNALRGRRSARPLEERGIELRSPAPDPEMQFFKEHYHREFRGAFEMTLSSLSSRERNILKLYYLEGLSSRAIGDVYGVTGATVRFWLKKWREAILADTQRLLRERLGVDASDIESLMMMVRSQFNISISRLLKPPV